VKSGHWIPAAGRADAIPCEAQLLVEAGGGMVALIAEPTIRYTASPLMIDLAPGWCKLRMLPVPAKTPCRKASTKKATPLPESLFRLMPSW